MYVCPRCKSKQKFGLQRERLKDCNSQIFIKCTNCRWINVIIVGSDDTIDTYRSIQRLKVKASKDPSLQVSLKRKIKRLYESLNE